MTDNAGVENGILIKMSYEFECTDGPESDLRVYRLRLMEEVNGCYDLDLDLATKDLDTDTDLLIGAKCSVDICRGEHMRTVYGIVTAVDYIGRSADDLLVNVRVVPAFQLLGQQTHSRIFQEMSVLEILKEVLGKELGQYARTLDTGAESRGTSSRDYCVQYRESDRDFCVRLMEEEGISYYFAHSEDADHEVLTLTYDNSDFGDVANVDGSALIPIHAAGADNADLESLSHISYLQSLTTTSILRRDYDFVTPLSLLEDAPEAADAKGYDRRAYHHTDRRFITDDIADRAVDHQEAANVRGKVARGAGNVTDFVPGKVFELDRHAREDLETRYLLTRVTHTGSNPGVVHGHQADGPQYRNSFQCIPVDVPLRPRHVTPKPRAYGPETAIVTGPGGEEIHVDEHGRIKVQFHWEEETTYDDTSSCWIRMRQQWSGPGWGFQFIPRIGMEVVVEFLGGDPSRPIITGTVYNGDNKYPYPLPANKTQSGIKTDTVSGDGSNELRFEDMAGCEEVYIHCQKDFTIATENDKNQTTGHDETLYIGNDRATQVDHDQSELIKNDKQIRVEGHHTEKIVKNMTLTVQGNQSSTIVKDCTESVIGSYSQSVAKSSSVTVSLASDESVGLVKSIQVGGAFSESVGGAKSIAAGGSVSITAGGSASFSSGGGASMAAAAALSLGAGDGVEMKAGKKMEIASADDATIASQKKMKVSAADELTILVGKSKLVMKKNGEIIVSGKKVNVKGSGPITIKGSKVQIN